MSHHNNIIYIFILVTVIFFSVSISVAVKVYAEDNNFVFVDSDKKSDPQMKSSVQEYWQALSEMNFSKAYTLESPYIRYQIEPISYNNLFSKLKRFDKIRIIEVRHNSTLYEVVLEKHVCVTNSDCSKHNKNIIYDYWINMGQKWHHVIKNMATEN